MDVKHCDYCGKQIDDLYVKWAEVRVLRLSRMNGVPRPYYLAYDHELDCCSDCLAYLPKRECVIYITAPGCGGPWTRRKQWKLHRVHLIHNRRRVDHDASVRIERRRRTAKAKAGG